MNQTFPPIIPISFVVTTFLTLWFFYKASQQSRMVMLLSCYWLLVTIPLFYTSGFTLQFRCVLTMLPGLVSIILLLVTEKGRTFVDSLNTEWLSYMHIMRVPLEIIIYQLFLYKEIPVIMTFEGNNFNIVAGYTAPFIAYFGYKEARLRKAVLWIWNLVCAALLLNLVFYAMTYGPFPFHLVFNEERSIIRYFPFIWLPGYVIPILLFSHIICIRQLIKEKMQCD